MDKRIDVVRKSFSKEQLAEMSVDDLVALVGEAGPNAKFAGTAVVRKKDGSIKYDNPSLEGSFEEK